MTKWSTAEPVLIEPSIEVVEETALAMAQATIQNAINAAGISRADLAAKIERPRSFVTRMLRGDHNLTIRTFARALASCGFELRFEYLPIQATTVALEFGEMDEVPRAATAALGHELAAA